MMLTETIVDVQSHGLFTCLSCSIAFHSADDQREHYRSDHHRYNMKRRVAGLTPVSVELFTQKVLERQKETAVAASPKGSTCTTCGKVYTTENAYRSHLNSKKHKENELKAISKPTKVKSTVDEEPTPLAIVPEDEQTQDPSSSSHYRNGVALTVAADATEEGINQTIDEKIAAARTKISATQCLFCPESSSSIEDNLTHMSRAHSFFIPDAEYLVDIAGLITYLGEKVAIGNACIYCSKEFNTLEAIRKHMIDKSHCKIAYDTDVERLEVSDFYDFSTSYPDWQKKIKKERKANADEGDEDEESEEDQEWEDEDNDGEADEVVEDSESEESEDEFDTPQVMFGDTEYELVLPTGTRIGHRSIFRKNATSHALVARRPGPAEDPESGKALVRKLLADKNSALVPRKGGFGAFGSGTEVVKARNAGEAKEAGRHVREFRDQQRREQFKTKVGYRHNSQKHFRDPLLQ
ncbi:C2H2 type zinc-finger-domain-containing protein [Abortiporus biennis]|nr:C2H2 type zinc-finger-domain-containing protein [Abortiporus biennis]